EGRLKMRGQQAPASGNEDDFELGDGTGAVDYAVEGEFDEPGAGAESGQEGSPATGTTAAPAAGEAAPAAEGSSPPIPAVAHSVETGGDVLLDAALAEQREAEKRGRRGRRRVRRTAVTAVAGDQFL